MAQPLDRRRLQWVILRNAQGEQFTSGVFRKAVEVFVAVNDSVRPYPIATTCCVFERHARANVTLSIHWNTAIGNGAGFGRVLLKLTKDVAFCIPPVSRDKARELLGRTHAARLLAGYRGSAALDVETVVDALVGLGRLASDLEGFVESIDVNPFVALPKGGCALDALIVLRKQ
jgi:hypothetical protein